MELTISKVTLSIKEESVFWVHFFAYSQICWKNFGWRYCCQTVASWKRLVRFVSLILPLRVIRMLFFFIRTILIIQNHRVPDPIYRCFPDRLERLLVPCLVFSLWICHSFCCVNYCDKLRDWAYEIYLEKSNQSALCIPKWNWENHTFFSWVPSENQTKPNLLAIHNAHVNSSESIRILEASTGSREKLVWQGQFRGLTSDFLRKWHKILYLIRRSTMKFKYVFF